MTATPPARRAPATIFLAWADPALAHDADAELAQVTLLQGLALVQCYVQRQPDAPPGELWARALAQLPLVNVTSQNTITATASTLEALADSVAQALAAAAGHGARASDLVTLLPIGSGQAGTEHNVVQTVVAGSAGAVGACIDQVVLSYVEVSNGLLPPTREWQLTQSLSSLTLDYQRLKDPATRASWNTLTADAKPSEIDTLPTYHRLSL